ncbi:MAG: shikimate kinase [Planctomycetota bacterium]
MSAAGRPMLVLVGMRGVGKTTVGRALAERLSLPFVDADAEIEARAGMPIPRIFAERGEPWFRALEAEVIGELLTRANIVLATGGGAVLDATTRERLRTAYQVVWLKAAADVLAARIAGSDRPSLTGADPADELAAVLAVREPLYREVSIHSIDVGERDAAAVVNQLFLWLMPV